MFRVFGAVFAINATKTELMVSGNSIPLDCLIMDYKHLGFLWNIGPKKSQLANLYHGNVNERLNRFWTTVYGLIKAGISFCAPYTRLQLFCTFAIPTLT